MPGPLSSAINSMPDPSASMNSLIATKPSPACFKRLVASSVATSAIRASTSWEKPLRCASPTAARRASPTSLASRTELTSVISQLPTRQRYGRPLAGDRFDRKFVRKPLGAAEPEPEPAAGRVPVGQRRLKIRNAGPVVGEGQLNTTACPLAHDLDAQCAAATVIHGVTGDFARRGDEFGLVDNPKTGLDRPRPNGLPHPHDIV